MPTDDSGFGPERHRSDFGLARLTVRWQDAFDAADAALRAAAPDLPADEIGRRRQALVAEEATTLGLLRSFAREHYVTPLPRLYFGPISPSMLGLPSSLESCIFELDGVLANSIAAHRAAWAETFNGFLLRRSALTTHDVMPFDPVDDYEAYIDGRPRLEGVRELLGSRGISLEVGKAADPPDAETVHGLANHKQAALRSILAHQGIAAFGASRQYLAAARHAGLRRAVVSVSENTGAMLDLSGLALLLDAVVDGEAVRAGRLRILPEPDTFLAAAQRLEANPPRTAVFVHDLVGVSAARAGGFGFVVGVERSGREAKMLALGADRVVRDLGELMGGGLSA
jgi:beta-phosphoglucomutase-like phosphatase (HAD superfamily)